LGAAGFKWEQADPDDYVADRRDLKFDWATAHHEGVSCARA
jgi:hypothetical protein